MISNALLSSDINLMHSTVLPRIWKLESVVQKIPQRGWRSLWLRLWNIISCALRMDGSMNKNGMSISHLLQAPGGIWSLVAARVNEFALLRQICIQARCEWGEAWIGTSINHLEDCWGRFLLKQNHGDQLSGKCLGLENQLWNSPILVPSKARLWLRFTSECAEVERLFLKKALCFFSSLCKLAKSPKNRDWAGLQVRFLLPDVWIEVCHHQNNLCKKIHQQDQTPLCWMFSEKRLETTLDPQGSSRGCD